MQTSQKALVVLVTTYVTVEEMYCIVVVRSVCAALVCECSHVFSVRYFTSGFSSGSRFVFFL